MTRAARVVDLPARGKDRLDIFGFRGLERLLRGSAQATRRGHPFLVVPGTAFHHQQIDGFDECRRAVADVVPLLVRLRLDFLGAGLSVDGLLALINSLDIVVGNKCKRFNNHVSNLNLLTKETAFETITNPNAQIEEILREICSFFNATKTNKKLALIRVTLAVFENNKIVKINFPLLVV